MVTMPPCGRINSPPPPSAHVVEDGNMIDMLEAERAHLFHKIAAMVHRVLGAEVPDPGNGFRTRGCGDHLESRKPCELNANGPHTASARYDEQALALVAAVTVNPQAIKQGHIGRNGGQWQGGGFGMVSDCGLCPTMRSSTSWKSE